MVAWIVDRGSKWDVPARLVVLFLHLDLDPQKYIYTRVPYTILTNVFVCVCLRNGASKGICRQLLVGRCSVRNKEVKSSRGMCDLTSDTSASMVVVPRVFAWTMIQQRQPEPLKRHGWAPIGWFAGPQAPRHMSWIPRHACGCWNRGK